jgi:hypothetical protein
MKGEHYFLLWPVPLMIQSKSDFGISFIFEHTQQDALPIIHYPQTQGLVYTMQITRIGRTVFKILSEPGLPI